jgi:hypothetical protein
MSIDGRGLIVLRRENYHRAIWDFCNNICHLRTRAVQQRARHSITPSARADRVGGTSMPSAFALGNLSHNIGVKIGAWRPSDSPCRGQNFGVQAMHRDGGHAMLVIQNGYALSTRQRILGVLFSALLALALFDPGVATAQEVKQIKLTEKHIQGFIAAHEDMAKLYDGANLGNSDPKVDAQAEAVAKKNGFASLAEYDVVSMNIAMIMSGIDPQTKKFTEPPEQIKQEIAALKADKSVPEAEKNEGLAQLEAALKDAKPIQFKENIALVLKYFDKLPALMELGPAD